MGYTSDDERKLLNSFIEFLVRLGAFTKEQGEEDYVERFMKTREIKRIDLNG